MGSPVTLSFKDDGDLVIDIIYIKIAIDTINADKPIINLKKFSFRNVFILNKFKFECEYNKKECIRLLIDILNLKINS